MHGAIAVRLMMNLSSSFDHRFIDGYDAAEIDPGAEGNARAAGDDLHRGMSVAGDAVTLLVDLSSLRCVV